MQIVCKLLANLQITCKVAIGRLRGIYIPFLSQLERLLQFQAEQLTQFVSEIQASNDYAAIGIGAVPHCDCEYFWTKSR
jgi:hypothetical protein